MKRILAIATALCFALPSIALAAPGDRGKPGNNKPPMTKPAFGAKPVGERPSNNRPPANRPPMTKPPMTKPAFGAKPVGKPRPPSNGHKPGHGHHKPPANWHKPRPSQFYWRGKWIGRYHAPSYSYPRGYSYRYWRVGDSLPLLFLATQYFFDNYSQLGLETPPPGYRWVRYGPDLLLVNTRSGSVEDVVYGAFY
jgi:Ni/Co efflux regulator RcnB